MEIQGSTCLFAAGVLHRPPVLGVPGGLQGRELVAGLVVDEAEELLLPSEATGGRLRIADSWDALLLCCRYVYNSINVSLSLFLLCFFARSFVCLSIDPFIPLVTFVDLPTAARKGAPRTRNPRSGNRENYGVRPKPELAVWGVNPPQTRGRLRVSRPASLGPGVLHFTSHWGNLRPPVQRSSWGPT